MTELGDIFAELGISQYLVVFIEQGFDTWDTILDITESDFDALNVKLGHRRKIQRKIALSRGLSSDRALASPSRNTPSDDRQVEDQKVGATKADVKDGGGSIQGAKRKYRRHPKPDENAPERPPSAYVIFSNKMREDLKGRHLSFTEIAKLVGENWQTLSPNEREPYEHQAFSAKEKFNKELAEYKKTDQYKEYSQYLVEFKARQSHQQQVADAEIAKRPKLEAHISTTSSGTNSSGFSGHGSDLPVVRSRVDSVASSNPWPSTNRPLSPSTQSPNNPNLKAAYGGSQNSPNPTSPTVLPGYRDSIYGAAQYALPWREGQRPESVDPLHHLPRISDPGDLRPTYAAAPTADTHPLNITGSLQHSHRTGQIHQTPPLIPSESTAGTTRSSGSSTSTNSSVFFTPRTPMEVSMDRTLPVPSLYPQKTSGTYENQLPPIRAPSLSPQTSLLNNAQQSPHSVPAITDFPTPMAPIRQHLAVGSRPRGLNPTTPNEEEDLDPVSALLRAGEIVDRTSRPWPP